jgi:hypothetical protein
MCTSIQIHQLRLSSTKPSQKAKAKGDKYDEYYYYIEIDPFHKWMPIKNYFMCI